MNWIKTALVIGLVGAAVPASADELTGTLRKIKDSGRIVLGVRDSSVPFSYQDENQNYVGFTVDVCKRIVEGLAKDAGLQKVRIETNPVTSSTRIPLIANGTIDLECSTTTNNADRQKQVAFTNTHFLSAVRFVSKKAQNISDIDALKGKTAVAVAGSTNLVMLNKVNAERKLGMNILTAKEPLEGFLLVENGRAAAFALDDVQLSVLIAQSKDPGAYVVSNDSLSTPEPYGIVLRRDDLTFKAAVDRITSELYRSPEIVAIYDKWFLKPVPPRNLNFNFPMTPELKRAYEHPTDSPDPTAYAL